MNLHEIEEQDFGRGSRLWDASPGVCCAAFQLGACSHTEAFDGGDFEDDKIHEPYCWTCKGWTVPSCVRARHELED